MKFLPVVSNIIYPVIGWFGDWGTFIAGIILMLGSGWMHYDRHEKSILADWMGMYGMSISCLAYLTNPYLLILIAPLPFFGNRIRNNLLIGMITLIAIGIDLNLYSLVAFGVAYGVRQLGHDTEWHYVSHSAWHVISGVGFYLMLI